MVKSNTPTFDKLFSSLQIGKKEVKNRIVSTPHATGWDDEGRLGDKHLRYLVRKAAGGAGLVMAFGSASVKKDSSASYGAINLWDEANEPYFRRLAKQVHAYDALLISQASHLGRRATSDDDGQPVSGASSIPEGVHNEIPHVMRTDEIPPLIDAFVDAAKRLERCGWDGIEITSLGGHLIEQFWSPKINNRNDKYGGSFENRIRLSIEIIEAVKAAVSEDFIIGFRLTADPKTEDIGLDHYDMIKIARRLDQLGNIDLFSVSGGTGANYKSQAAAVPGDTFERGLYNNIAKEMKENLSVPVLVAGRVLDPEQAENSLEQQQCDLVGMTRAIIADPDMPKMAEQGRVSDIRPCIACNEGCIGRLYSGLPMICTVNPAIGDDSLESNINVIKPLHIVIVGAGPAGMETARVSASIGHSVTLLEATGTLGGKVLLTSSAKERPHYDLHIKWLTQEMERLGIKVLKNFRADANNILSFNPDTVVIANGATQYNPYLNYSNVTTEAQVLRGDIELDKNRNIIIYDREGVYRGASLALNLADSGAGNIEIATPHWSVCDKMDDMRKAELYKLLAKTNVRHSANKKLIPSSNHLILKDTFSDEEKPIKEDEVVVLVGFEEGDNKLYEDLKRTVPQKNIRQIGDSVSPRRLHVAIQEGAKTAYILQ